MALLQLQVVLLLVAAGAARIVTPGWDSPIPRQGHACTDASRSQVPGQRANTRWSFWAAPSGAPPADGWPIYLEFQADPFNSDMFRHPPNETCGDPPPGPPVTPPLCLALLNAECPEARFAKAGFTGLQACEGCVNKTLTDHPRGLKECGQFAQFEPMLHCIPDVGEETPKDYQPFATPAESMAACFNPDGSWRIGKGANHTGCTFNQMNQMAGELWQARLHQLLLANGIAVVTLNPYSPDTW
jgi:hypothetical protein